MILKTIFGIEVAIHMVLLSYTTPCIASPLGFGLKFTLHKEAQQQLRKIFKFLLACILETYSMQTFVIFSKKNF